MAKATANYAKLLDQATIMHEGFTVRVDRAMSEIDRLLKGFPEAAKVKQLVAHYATQRAFQLDAGEQVDRYTRLAAEQAEGDKPTKA